MFQFILDGIEMQKENALVRRASSGDTEAFSELVKKYQTYVYNIAYQTVGNREDADDITQETFLKAYRSLSTFRGSCRFSSWLYRICINAAHDCMRAANRCPLIVQTTWGDDDENEIELPDTSSNSRPDEIIEREEVQQAVRAAIASLSDDHREILTLRDLNGYSYEEIADMLGLEFGTVKSRINRARASVKAYLIQRNFFENTSSYHTKQQMKRGEPD